LLKEHLLAGLLKLELEGQSGLFHAMYFIATRGFCQHISWGVMQSFLSYDDANLSWLGLSVANAPHTINAWAARLHPQDKSVFLSAFATVLQEQSAASRHCVMRQRWRMAKAAGA
jgi:hypothetical protein